MPQLSSASAQRAAAERFGQEVSRTMRARGISRNRLAAAVGVSRSALNQYLSGWNLPSLAVGQALARALDSELLAELIVHCRTRTCEVCGAEFVDPGSPRRYCSERCRRVVATRNAGVASSHRAAVAERRLAEAAAELRRHQAAVAAMCRDCEPEGVCRNASCPLRPLSPLPMLASRPTPVARPAPGPWGNPENRARQLTAVREANARRWTAAARAEQRVQMLERHAAMTAEERAARAQRISAGRLDRQSEESRRGPSLASRPDGNSHPSKEEESP